MSRLTVRRLAAVDMHGTKGTVRRRRIILVEFLVGLLACPALGAWLLLSTTADAGWWLGVWLIGVGINYLPLAIYALALASPGALARELDGVDIWRELRRYGLAQFAIAVPLFVAVAALLHVRGERSRRVPDSRP